MCWNLIFIAGIINVRDVVAAMVTRKGLVVGYGDGNGMAQLKCLSMNEIIKTSNVERGGGDEDVHC